MKSKFKPGDVAAVKGTRDRFLITQVAHMTCAVCTQVSYEGRLLRCERVYDAHKIKNSYAIAVTQKMVLTECELEEVKEEEPDEKKTTL